MVDFTHDCRPVAVPLRYFSFRQLVGRGVLARVRSTLRQVFTEYLAHYNQHRPHCALGRRPPQPPPASLPAQRFRRRKILHGLINEYKPAA
jgi:Integrase core domain